MIISHLKFWETQCPFHQITNVLRLALVHCHLEGLLIGGVPQIISLQVFLNI